MNRQHLLHTLIAFLYLAFAANSLIAETTATTPVIIDGKYQISNLAELRWVSENSDSWDKDFIITADIDATDTATWNDGKGFSPIGTSYYNRFSGSFENKETHVISNLFINRPEEDKIDLFGDINLATIESIYLTNISMTGDHKVGGRLGGSTSTRLVGGGGAILQREGMSYVDTEPEKS